eukprot:COSAG01_NODE_29081_length_646_cov_0.544790_1_plen_122_part_00
MISCGHRNMAVKDSKVAGFCGWHFNLRGGTTYINPAKQFDNKGSLPFKPYTHHIGDGVKSDGVQQVLAFSLCPIGRSRRGVFTSDNEDAAQDGYSNHQACHWHPLAECDKIEESDLRCFYR